MFPDCSGAATEDGVIDFAGRDKTSSSELGLELGIKGEFAHTSLHLRRKRATGMGYMFGPCTERCDVGF